MIKTSNKSLLSIVKEYFYIALGSAVAGFAFSIFFIPNQIAPGGVSGVATLLNALFGVRVGLAVLLMNIPIYLLSFKKFGTTRVIRSLFATVIMSMVIDYIPLPDMFIHSIASERLLSSIFGGVLVGAGIGLVIKNNATTGGTDMIATLIHGWFSSISISWVLFGIDFLVVLAAGIFLEPIMALYAFIGLFVSAKAMDFVQIGVNTAKAFFIISEKSDVISQAIIDRIERGVTILNGAGAYSGNDKKVLLCVVRRNQITKLRDIIKEVDEYAFVIVHDVKEVMGEGFTRDVTPN